MSPIQAYVEAVFEGLGCKAMALRYGHPELEDLMDNAVWQRLSQKEEQGYGTIQHQTE